MADGTSGSQQQQQQSQQQPFDKRLVAANARAELEAILAKDAFGGRDEMHVWEKALDKTWDKITVRQSISRNSIATHVIGHCLCYDFSITKLVDSASN